MEIKLVSQEDMVLMAGYFIPSQEYDSLDDFERYCVSRDLIKEWNLLDFKKRVEKSHQIELYGFQVETSVWN